MASLGKIVTHEFRLSYFVLHCTYFFTNLHNLQGHNGPFPTLRRLLKGIIKTRLLEFHPYDNLGFHEFPIRVGFTENEVEKGLLDGQTSLLQHEPHLYASLLQSWCCWGLLPCGSWRTRLGQTLCQVHGRLVCHPDDAAFRNRSRPAGKQTADDGSGFPEAMHFGGE